MPLFFDYELPEHLIAQRPAEPRDSARLLIVYRDTGQIEHHHVRDLPELLAPRDLLVVNNTKVIPARLIGTRMNTGGKWESLFLREHENGTWELLAQTRGYAQPGERFQVGNGPLELTLVGRTAERHWLMTPNASEPADVLLTRHGQIPLPPYIRKGHADATDTARYQTVYAQSAGSVAAPTAGLHFTSELLARLRETDINTANVTLHVGLGTFAPVKADDPTQHAIHSEWCEVAQETVDAIVAAKQRGNRVVAVGTTTTRTLETAAKPNGLRPFRGESELFIHPPYSFAVMDALMTNFHLPRTTLLLLVQAFVGPDLLRHAYETAIAHEYRFYSYGDAMLIV